MNLCTLKQIEQYLLEDFGSNPSFDTIEAERVERFIVQISKEIETICMRTFNVADYTEIYDGQDTFDLLLNQYPVNSLSSVWYIDTQEKNSTEIDLDYVGIEYEEGSLYFSGKFSKGRRNLRVSYNAGYSEIPDDLNFICIKTVVNELSLVDIDGNLTKEKLGDASWEYKSSKQSNDALKSSLNSWIKVD